MYYNRIHPHLLLGSFHRQPKGQTCCYDDRRTTRSPMHTYTYIFKVQATRRAAGSISIVEKMATEQQQHLELEVILFRRLPVLLLLPLPLARVLQNQEKR